MIQWELGAEQADLVLLWGQCVSGYPSLHPWHNQPEPVPRVFFLHTSLKTQLQKLTAHPLLACQLLKGICGIGASSGTDLQAEHAN